MYVYNTSLYCYNRIILRWCAVKQPSLYFYYIIQLVLYSLYLTKVEPALPEVIHKKGEKVYNRILRCSFLVNIIILVVEFILCKVLKIFGSDLKCIIGGVCSDKFFLGGRQAHVQEVVRGGPKI